MFSHYISSGFKSSDIRLILVVQLLGAAPAFGMNRASYRSEMRVDSSPFVLSYPLSDKVQPSCQI
jgi:hypothetical protein